MTNKKKVVDRQHANMGSSFGKQKKPLESVEITERKLEIKLVQRKFKAKKFKNPKTQVKNSKLKSIFRQNPTSNGPKRSSKLKIFSNNADSNNADFL